jgi:predicted RNA-binding protein (virulence factor B family)
MNDLVTHDRYGLGTVVNVEEDVAVLVDFGGNKRERIIAPYSKLTKL